MACCVANSGEIMFCPTAEAMFPLTSGCFNTGQMAWALNNSCCFFFCTICAGGGVHTYT
jgi:hypothetical protein